MYDEQPLCQDLGQPSNPAYQEHTVRKFAYQEHTVRKFPVKAESWNKSVIL